MKRLLVIGAGENQYSIIKLAKDMGCFVIAVSPRGNYPGIEIADEWYEQDIFNKDDIAAYAKNKKIDGVISDQSDMIAPIVAYVAEKLGLPNWGYENALYFTDKAMMRSLYEKLGFPVPKYRKAENVEDAFDAAQEIGYPVVVKPTNSFSSKGITLVREAAGIPKAYTLAYESSRTHEVVIEKYIKGSQYFSQGFVSAGKLNMFAFSDRYYYDLPDVFIPYTNAFPALISEDIKERMRNMMERIIEELEPAFGHVWAEWIFDDEADTLYIVEMAIRGAGAHVTTEIIPRAYGVDTQPYLIKAALGEENGEFLKVNAFKNKAAAFYSYLLPKGKVERIEGIEELKKIPGVVAAYIKNVHVGEETVDIQDKNSRYGLIVVAGKDRDELNRIWEDMKATLNIAVSTEDGIRGAIWS